MAESEGGGGRARVDQGWKMTKLRPDVHKLVKAVSAERGETIQEYVQEALGRVAAGDHRRYIVTEMKKLEKGGEPAAVDGDPDFEVAEAAETPGGETPPVAE